MDSSTYTALATAQREAAALREAAQLVVEEVDVAHSYECRSLRPAPHGAFAYGCDCRADTAVAALRAAIGGEP